MNTNSVIKTLTKIGLSPAEAYVYSALLGGAKTVQEIMKITAEKRPTIYYSLNSLEKRGLVSKTGSDYGSKFQLEPAEKLEEVVQANIRKQTTLLIETKKIKDLYSKENNTQKVLVSYFDSFESIKTAIFFCLYSKEKVIRSIVPGQNFFHEIGKDFVSEYVKEKAKRKIKTTALWEDIPTKQILEEYYENSSIRQLPTDMHNSFDTTIFMYDDKTLYISPLKEQYAVLIQSQGHTKLMRTTFDYLWAHSKSINHS